VSWLRYQKIAGLEYWVQLLFNFTPVSVRQVQTGHKSHWVELLYAPSSEGVG